MAAQCRAKDPNSCRVHGTNGDYDRLQRVADHAAKSGDIELYMETRNKMDALQDDPIVEEDGKISAKAVEAGASLHWSVKSWENASIGTKQMAREDARKKLEVAYPFLINGKVTNSAITAVAKHLWESRGNGSWNRAGLEERDSCMRTAQRFLNVTTPHLSK